MNMCRHHGILLWGVTVSYTHLDVYKIQVMASDLLDGLTEVLTNTKCFQKEGNENETV